MVVIGVYKAMRNPNDISRNLAIEQVFNAKLFQDMCRKYGGRDYEDLKSEAMLSILEVPKQKLDGIIEKGYLLPYVLSMLRNMVSTKGGKGWSRFRRQFGNREGLLSIEDMKNLRIEQVDYFDFRSPGSLFILAGIEDSIGDDFSERARMETVILEKIEQDCIERAENKYWYNARLLKLSFEYKNPKKMAEAVGIHYNSVLYALKEYREHLAEWIKSQY